MLHTIAGLAVTYPVATQAAGIGLVVALAVLQIRRYGQRQEERTNTRS